MKKLIIGVIMTVVMVFILRCTYYAGVEYAIEEVGKAYSEGLMASIGSLDVGETSVEYTLSGEEMSEYLDEDIEDIKYVIIRTK